MKKNYKKSILIATLALFGLNNVVNAQALLKDLDTVSYYNSNPDQFINVNGTMYIHTKDNGYNNQIWKSDGTAIGTILLKDAIISSNQTTPVQMFNMNDTLYYFVNPNSLHANSATLWKSDGTTAGTILIDSLNTGDPFADPSQGQPRNFTVVGNKLFFQMAKGSGLELWVTDGTVGGAHQVIDLWPGTVSGVVDQPMVAYNGKVYFNGTPVPDDDELYASDGTAAGTVLVKDIDANNTVTRSSDPTNFKVYNNELYFYALSGKTGSSNGTSDMWKTDGTTAGTILVSPGEFNAGQVIFKNELYFGRSPGIWKTDGTTSGTVLAIDSTNTINGANSNYLIASYATTMTVAPYVQRHYRSTDGTTALSISTNVGNGASFTVLGNTMYNNGGSSSNGLWYSDGTNTGSGQLATNASYCFFAFNGNLYYNGRSMVAQNSSAGYGNELWWLNGGAATGIKQLNNEQNMLVYPNPSTGIYNFRNKERIQNLKIYNLQGKLIFDKEIKAFDATIDLIGNAPGLYFYQLTDEKNQLLIGKIILE